MTQCATAEGIAARILWPAGRACSLLENGKELLSVLLGSATFMRDGITSVRQAATGTGTRGAANSRK